LKLQEALRHQAIRDPLTGLFNRRFMLETLERELYRMQRKESVMGVIMVDIDHFKRFNDTFGHSARDAVLSALGRMLLAHVRKEDVACRDVPSQLDFPTWSSPPPFSLLPEKTGR